MLAVLTGGLAACSSAAGSSLPAREPSAVAQPTQNASTSTNSLKAAARPLDVASGEMPLSADSLPGDPDANNNFIDSIGVNTHLNLFGSSPYTNYGAVKNALVNLGVRHIRDAFSTQNLNNYENNLADLASNGIHSELVLTESQNANNFATMDVSGTQAAAYLQAGHFAQSLETIEGINEPDESHSSSPSAPVATNWVNITQSEQKNLYQGVQALTFPAKRVPVVGPSVVNLSLLPQIGDLSQYMDYGNIHNYSGGYVLTPGSIVSAVTSEATTSEAKPVIASENGYATGSTGQGMPDAVMLDYSERLFFKQFGNHVKRTLWYELLDENSTPNDYWNNSGLLTASYTPKAAYTGIKNVISLLKDQTAYTRRIPLNVSFGGQPQSEYLTHLLLQKNDGSYWLVVWSDASEWTPANNGSPGTYPTSAAQQNSLNFLGTYIATVTEYDQDATGAMTSKPLSVSNGSTAVINVSGRPTIYKIIPGTAPVVPSAGVIPNPAAHWALDEGSGTVASDSVDPAGNLAVPANSLKIAWISGEYNAGLSFNGTQISTTKTFLDTTQSYSASAWVQMTNLSGYQAAVTANGNNQAAFSLDFTPQSNLSFTTYPSDSAGGGTRIGSSITPVLGKWYAVAATFNGSTRKMSFYVNGVLQEQQQQRMPLMQWAAPKLEVCSLQVSATTNGGAAASMKLISTSVN